MGSVIDAGVKVGTFGAVDTDFSGRKAADRAYDAQAQAAHEANVTAQNTKKEQKEYLQPYYDAGNKSLGQLSSGDVFGEGGFQADPGYQFALSEGNKAINASAASRGNANSGATLKALSRFNQNTAASQYDNAYNRNYNRLSQLAGYGSNAAANFSGVAGVAGQQIANNQIGLGNAQAANQVAASNRDSQFINAGIQGGAMALACDERLKTNIESVSKDELSEMKSHLKAYKFNYKSNEFGTGDYIGVMAQDLEKSKLGRTLVIEDESGNKLIDMKRVMMLFLASMVEA